MIQDSKQHMLWIGPCAGDYDHLPEAAFYMVGGIADVIAKAEKMSAEAA